MTRVHGIQVTSSPNGPRPITAGDMSVIGLVGTAPKGPVNTPVLIAGSRIDAVKQFGVDIGTIPDALDGILDQAGALIVVINVLDPATHNQTVAPTEYTLDSATDELTLPDKYSQNEIVRSQDTLTTYVVDTDYAVDPDTGNVTRVSTGSIPSGAVLNIGYEIPDETAVLDADIIGGVDSGTGAYAGISALIGAESEIFKRPKILIAPSYSSTQAIAAELLSVADRLRAIAPIEGPNTNDAAAIAYRGNFGSKRGVLVDPSLKVWDVAANAEAIEGNSSRIAGVFVKNDVENGIHVNPDNSLINGIVGTARSIDFTMGDPNSRANLLNDKEVSTVIRQNGYVFWGGRTMSSDKKWAFINHVRLDDMIIDALIASHMWAVSRGLTATYTDDVVLGVNDFLNGLAGQQIISGGKCWFDADLNTAISMDSGLSYFNMDYGRYGVAEQIKFAVAVNNDYTVERVFAA